MSVKHVSKAVSHADYTSVVVTGKDHDSFKQKTNLALTRLNQWFYINQLLLNTTKTNIIKFTPKTTAHVPLDNYYKDNVTDKVKSTTFLGAYRQSYELEKPCGTNSSKTECCMLLNKELNSHFKSQFRHQKQKSFLFACCKFILCSKMSFILWGQNL